MAPARQGLCAGHQPGREVEDRLVEEDDLPEAQGVAQVLHELEPLTRVLLIFR